ncbi:MAG: FliO/MopB family protein [Alphaproteobacteria bacterium]|nr:FliO/MopB family protein [Alphaproteobacteria bacterium]MCK5518609.1 FliO/MopB family protein [Alphaproteobacteria bacterium]MCK5555911.1 FliO/MopB family protein [Alphaproteobacteria bacterium]MCK5658275.1 FliO/MopB family protein [Alphaproteobacteria bacterium]
MDTQLLIKFFSAFVFVISLMVLLSWGLKRIGLSATHIAGGSKRRLKVVEFLSLDHRRRLVLVRCDDREHLLLLGSQGETVVETGIKLKAEDEREHEHVVAFSRDPRNVKF